MATGISAFEGVRGPESFQLFETMAYLPSSGIRNQAAHLARLSASAAQLFELALDGDDIRAVLRRSLAKTRRQRRVRLTLSSTGEAAVELGPMPAEAGRPVRLVFDTEPVSSSSVWLAHKTTQREVYDTRAARHPDADDVILVNEHGQLTESTIANLAVRLTGTWFTPPVTSGCLPGVERARLVSAGHLTERVLTAGDLRANDGLALVSSLRGWRDATLSRVDNLPE
jgi:para-aminobenzoate synthetase/4-amino-4-deoxychorismate lyase